MPLRHLSRQTVHVNLDRPGQRKVYLPKSEITNKGVTRAVAEMDLDDKGGYVAHKVHKAYASRTDKTLDLFDYVISHMHNEKANKRDRVDPENNDDENDPCDQHEDDDDDGDDEVPKHSRKDRLISYRAYNYTSDPEGYCYAMLMLFVPWVKECDLLLKPSGDSYSSAEDAFKAHRPTIEYWLSKNEALANLFAEFTRSADAMQDVPSLMTRNKPRLHLRMSTSVHSSLHSATKPCQLSWLEALSRNSRPVYHIQAGMFRQTRLTLEKLMRHH